MTQDIQVIIENESVIPISIDALFQIIDGEIQKNGFTAAKAKLAKATCRDDSNGEIREVAKKWGYINPKVNKHLFNLESAAAVPSYGEALVEAFYHHIPDKGVGVIIFAPHYGIDSQGRIGFLDREGMEEPGKSCGANHGIISLWELGQYGPYQKNLELTAISERLVEDRERILQSSERVKTMAEIEYDRFLPELMDYVKAIQKGNHHKIPILIAAGINIDTHRDTNNQFLLKSLNWVDNGKIRLVNYQ